MRVEKDEDEDEKGEEEESEEEVKRGLRMYLEENGKEVREREKKCIRKIHNKIEKEE